jgi:hypothetical protein
MNVMYNLLNAYILSIDAGMWQTVLLGDERRTVYVQKNEYPFKHDHAYSKLVVASIEANICRVKL